MAGSSDKSEKPSARRLEKAREEGQYASSRELVAACQFAVFVTITAMWFSRWLQGMKMTLRAAIVEAFHSNLDIPSLSNIVRTLANRAFVPVLIVGAITMVASLATHLAATRLGFSLKKLTPNFKQFNPIKKLKDIATQGPASLMQAAAMLILFGAAIYTVARDNIELFFTLPFNSFDVGIAKVGAALLGILWKAVGLFLVFGFLDLVRQKRRFMKTLKMSKQEIKEEHKESEGNPLVKGKIRRLQRDMARRKMMQEVATATAVIVNPTHFAVALRYDHNSMSAPLVVAKGKNYLALRIRERAIANGVPLVENPPLAQALYKSVDVGREIPTNLYRAVAEVLGYIYRLSQVTR